MNLLFKDVNLKFQDDNLTFQFEICNKSAPSDTLYDRFKRGNKMCLPVDVEQLILSMAIFLQYVFWIQILLEFEKKNLFGFQRYDYLQ